MSLQISIKHDLVRFSQVFSQMLDYDEHVDVPLLIRVISSATVEIKRNLDAIKQPVPLKDDVSVVSGELDRNLVTYLYLIVIFSKIRSTATEEEIFTVMQLVHEVVKLDPRTSEAGASLLHMAVNSETPVEDFYTNEVVHFPCAAAAKLLLDVGADAGAMDVNRNTPLHCIVGYQRIVTDFVTLHSIIRNLIEHGAHIDVVNLQRMTPLQAATTGVARIILKSQARLSLKCLAAQSVCQHGVIYRDQVPKDLEKFIDLHGPLED